MADALESLLRDCTVRVTGGPMPGAGFFVAPGKVLTCVHVIGESAALVVLWERDGQPVLEVPVSGRVAVLADRGRPIPALDRDYPDIAVLEVDGLDDHPCVDIDPSWPSGEDRFLVFGYPMEGGAVQLTPARLTYRGAHGVAPTTYLDLASDTIKPGMSGAAVLNLRSGAVCAVVVASKHPAHPDGALAIPWSAVATELGEVLAVNRAFHLGDTRWGEAAAAVPGYRGKVVAYLRALIDWLDNDPWPRDRRFGGPALTPAALERKLRIRTTSRAGEEDIDADDVVKQCRRLVTLGGSGSGKTWLAKRTARRCAEEALNALAAGGAVDEVELPLYTTCSRLFRADGGIREAAVSSALDQLGDLGGPRGSVALRVLFTAREQNAPTLLVIDALDEAHGSQERLRQADTLPWRIMLTTRPNSWNHQLNINDNDESHRVGELQPLRYPDDVDPFIHRWFNQQPEWGNDLAAQITRRPGLQQAATVPLILALYCIVGGGEPLPDFRRDLYTRVLNRMLTGRWRRNDDSQPDAATCLQTLNAWALAGATNHPVSGLGTWADDIPTERARLSQADMDALDNVATPLAPPDLDTRMTPRRFIHRSIREHLVAEHIASLGTDEAIEMLLPHLWFDPDWEYAAPAALASHPQHDQLLRDVIYRAAGSRQIPGDLSVIEAGWEFRGFLARVASESREADWAPDLAVLISQAREELARAVRIADLGGTPHWATSNRNASDALLDLLVDGAPWSASVARGLIQLAPTAEDMRQTREKLIGLLADVTDSGIAVQMAGIVDQLGPTAQERRRAQGALLRLLAVPAEHRTTELTSALSQLSPAAEDRRLARDALLKLLANQTSLWTAARLADGVTQFSPTAEDRRLARDALLRLLASKNKTWIEECDLAVQAVIHLAPTAEDKRQARETLLGILASPTGRSWAFDLAGMVAKLDPTTEEKHQARSALLRLLTGTAPEWHEALAGVVAQLAQTTEDKHLARETLLGLLTDTSDSWVATQLVGMVAAIAPTADDKRQARQKLLGLLASATSFREAALMARAVAQLDPAPEDRRQACRALFRRLGPETQDLIDIELAAGIVDQLDPPAEDRRLARDALLGYLSSNADDIMVYTAARDIGSVVELDLTPESKRLARETLLRLLGPETESWMAAGVVSSMLQLDPTAENQHQAREILVGLLGRDNDYWNTTALADVIDQLDPSAGERRRVLGTLLGPLAHETDIWKAAHLARLVALFDPTPQGKRQALDVLLELLSRNGLPWQTGDQVVAELSALVDQLEPTGEGRRKARDALLGLLNSETHPPWVHSRPLSGVVQLAPTADDRRQARGTLLALLVGPPGGWATELANKVVEIAPTAEEKRQARHALLALLDSQTDGQVAAALAGAVIQLDPTADDKRRARKALVALLDSHTDGRVAAALAGAVIQLDPTADDRRQACDGLVDSLASETNSLEAAECARRMVELDPTAETKRLARSVLLGLLGSETNGNLAATLAREVVQLDPTALDVGRTPTWASPPAVELFAAARRNSPQADWLEALPLLPAPKPGHGP